MNFTASVRKALLNYATFSGRAQRSEYWWFVLFGGLIRLLATTLDITVFSSDLADLGPISVFTSVALLLPTLAVSVRRLHDVNHRAGFLLLGLIPIAGAIVLIVAFLQDSDTDNAFGPSPRYSMSAGPASVVKV